LWGGPAVATAAALWWLVAEGRLHGLWHG